MQQVTYPISKELVLVGGGHTHAIALRLLGMNPLPGVRLTLISNTSHTPYSGMLPAHVAGFYSFDTTHIDLRRLAQFSGAQFYLDTATGLDLAKNQVICAHHPPINFDYLSLDIGSTPSALEVPGAQEYAVPAKPVPQFLQAWEQLLQQVTHTPEQPLSITVVGGGAGGVELTLNMQSRLNSILKSQNLEIHLFHRGRKLLAGHNSWVSRRLEKILRQRGIKLHLQENVVEVLPDRVIGESGVEIACNHVFWVTQASAPSWIKVSGLATDSQGFVLVEDTLQSVSHPHIFAAGDIATMQNYQRPKAGVFAVRQGKPLYANLKHIVAREALKPYRPQKRYLGLIGTGDRRAIASWANLGWQSPWLWKWKDHIDRKFMRLFEDLPVSHSLVTSHQSPIELLQKYSSTFTPYPLPLTQTRLRSLMYCAGCGSKVGGNSLKQVLQRLQITTNPDVLVGIDTPDDAAVVQVPSGKLLVQTIDYFPALVSDPFVFGQIATNHCLSDIFAMGATPQTALAIATVPHGIPAKVEETLYQLLCGANQVLQASHTALVGGHTTEGEKLAFGLACNGLVAPDKVLRKNGMQPGQVLILTKALGTGTLFAAQMQYQAKGRWIDEAIESMLLSNQTAAEVFLQYGATALTDITGFGLLGHLLEMVETSGVGVRLDLRAIPSLTGALHTLKQGFVSSLHSQNIQVSQHIKNLSEVDTSAKYLLLFDPQTAGGLLGTVWAEQAEACLKELRLRGYEQSQIVGEVVEDRDNNIFINR